MDSQKESAALVARFRTAFGKHRLHSPDHGHYRHGTSVAGIIGAVAFNGKGGRGIAYNAIVRGYNLLEPAGTAIGRIRNTVLARILHDLTEQLTPMAQSDTALWPARQIISAKWRETAQSTAAATAQTRTPV